MSEDLQNDSEKWESICCRCGRCCYEKVDFEGRIYYTELPCEFLDTETNLCRVYTERDVKRPGCVRLTDEILPKGIMPADCPYVSDIDNYPAPTLLDDGDPEET
ncbi:MAG: hypothetical protein OEU57_09715 [Desulfuromonadales bacterium]|nr:hypothetical protein [Desulfuromonadales bacterium]